MVSRWLQAAVAICVIALLTSCSLTGRQPIERPLYYDVRDVVVIANANVSQVLIAGIDRRVAEAIGATVRPVALPRVVLAVTLQDYAPRGVWADRRPRATFKVVATSVDSGLNIAAGTFTVFSVTDSPMMIDESLAEEVAARIRFAFSLSTPPVVRPEKVRRPAAPAPHMSTRINGDDSTPSVTTPGRDSVPAEAEGEEPKVIMAPVLPELAPAAPAEKKVDAPAVPKKAEVQPTGGPAAGTNIEEGANATIKLSPAPPVCDPKEDPECQDPAQ